MALKKPTDFFGENKNNHIKLTEGVENIPENLDAYKSNLKNIETLNEFVENFGSFRDNLEKIQELEVSINQLKEEIEGSLSQEDLDHAIMSNLLILEENVNNIQKNLKGINRKDLSAIREEVEDISDKILHVVEKELPKYKSLIKTNELSLDKRLSSYQEEVDEKLDLFESVIENKFQIIEEELEGINESSLIKYQSQVEDLTNLVNQELPKYKKQFVENSLKIEKQIQSIEGIVEESQQELNQRIQFIHESLQDFIDQEIPKYQELLLNSRIQNDEKIEKISHNLISQINSLTENNQRLNEELSEKSNSLELNIQDKVSKLEDYILTTKQEIEETSNTYKSLYKAIEAKGLKDQNQFESQNQLITNLNNQITEVYQKVEDIKKEIKVNTFEQEDQSNKINQLHESFTKKLNLLENDIEYKNEKIKEANSVLLDQFYTLKEFVSTISVDQINEKYEKINKKVSYIEDVFNKFNEKTILNESLLNEPPNVKNGDPLTPLDQKFVTLDQLQEHYRLFINRVQQQLVTIGGGGETRLEFLDDVDRNSVKRDGYVISYQASTGKFIGTSVVGSGSGDYAKVAGIATYATTSGIATVSEGLTGTPNITVGVITATDAFFSGNISVAGTITYEDVTNIDSLGIITARQDVNVQRNLFVSGITTLGASNGIGTVTIGIGQTALYVDGNARVTGILTVGKSSVVIDGDNNTITAGEVLITGSSITIGDNVTINTGATGINSAPNVIYVAKDGDDAKNGTSIDNAKLTIAGAVAIAQTGTVIKVLSGTYNENNPIEVPAFVSIVGDSLKTVTVVPNNSTQDIFHVNKGTYLAHMTFTGHVSPSAAVAFPPNIAENVGGGDWESPYVQNCTSNTTTGTGMRIDGSLAEGLKSMVVDAYTQYNQGGVGIAITNNGYAQLVSVFTICCNEGITAHKGGQCSLANSNTDFGTFGLVADGVSDLQFTGTASTAASGQANVTVAITTSTRPYGGQVVYFNTLYYSVNTIEITDGGSGYTATPSVSIAAPSGPNGVTASAFATLDGDRVSSITIISSGSQYTSAPSITISAPDSGTTAIASAILSPIYYTINSSTPVVAGITTLSLEENLINTVGSGSTVYFHQVSKITATSHTFEYVGAGNTITLATPARGGVAIQENEVVERNGGRVTFTSTDQAGNFRIGNDIVINQNNGTISGRAFTRSLFNQMTPFILALS